MMFLGQLTVIGLSLAFWPSSLFLANLPLDFFHYLLPSLLVLASFFLFRRFRQLHLLPLIFIPLIEPKLALFLPVYIVSTLAFSRFKNIRISLSFLFLSLFVAVFVFKPFLSETIFQPDHEAQQAVIQRTRLYPNVFLARTFHNKARIYLDKFNDNFFALTDPNNYFFSFHPREIIVDNQNLNKFPYAGIAFFLFGLFYLNKSKDRFFVVFVFLALLLNLCLLQNFDRTDFVLFVPLGLIYLHGFQTLKGKFRGKYRGRFAYVLLLFLLLAIPEFFKIFFDFG